MACHFWSALGYISLTLNALSLPHSFTGVCDALYEDKAYIVQCLYTTLDLSRENTQSNFPGQSSHKVNHPILNFVTQLKTLSLVFSMVVNVIQIISLNAKHLHT